MLRIVFMGTPQFSVPMLAALVGVGHDVAAVYSQPPRPAGRGMGEKKSPVHEFAAAAEIPVLTPGTLRDEQAQAIFRDHKADVAVVVAYGLILPQPVLAAPSFGCLNMHASRLPRWRGAAPIQRAIMAGDSETAAMVMQMDEGLDTGPVLLGERVSIGPNTTAGELHDTLADVGADLMVRALAALERGSLTPTPQAQDGIIYATKIEKAEARIDFARPAHVVHNHIRALSPFPGAWFEASVQGNTERIKALRSVVVEGSGVPGTVLDDQLTIACSEGAVRLTEVQRAGKRPMGAGELLRGFSLITGSCVR